jgi:hypothetical protein
MHAECRVIHEEPLVQKTVTIIPSLLFTAPVWGQTSSWHKSPDLDVWIVALKYYACDFFILIESSKSLN